LLSLKRTLALYGPVISGISPAPDRRPVDVDAPATPSATLAATPAPSGGPKRRTDQMSREPASPPATPRKPKAVRIASPHPMLMHSRHATGSPLRDEARTRRPSRIKPRSRKKRRMQGLDHLGAGECGRRRSWREGVTTLCSTPDSLYESWSPGRRETRGKRT